LHDTSRRDGGWTQQMQGAGEAFAAEYAYFDGVSLWHGGEDRGESGGEDVCVVRGTFWLVQYGVCGQGDDPAVPEDECAVTFRQSV